MGTKQKKIVDTVTVTENAEERLGELVRMFGVKNSNGGYTLGLSQMHLIINGSFAEEFEDCKGEAPCIVNYIAVDSDNITPWFNMQATSGMTGLVWGDKYSIGAMGRSNVKKIVDYVEDTYGSTTKDSKRLIELRRAEWLKIVKDSNNVFLVGIYGDDNDKKNKKGVDLDHAVDCIYCCYSRDKSDDLGLTLNELKNHILSSIDKTTAFFIRVKYPTRESLKNSYYLAGQDGERWARWNYIITLINKKIHRMIKPHEVKELIASDPKDVLVNGRLKNDEPKKVREIKKITAEKKAANKKNAPRSWPLLYSMEDHGLPDVSTNQWHKWYKEKQEEYAAKVKKLGHPRFEVILSEEYRQYYQLQVMGIIWMYAFNPDDKDKADNPKYARFYNGTKETSIPALETKVIDHFDSDKTPYILGDIIRLCSSDSRNDPGKGFFCRIDSPQGEQIGTFDFMSLHDIDDRDWHKDRYSREAKWRHEKISKPARKNRKLTVSDRTGMSYAQMGYHARLSSETVQKLWNAFDEKFRADEQDILDRDMIAFDHEKFAKILQEARSPVDMDTIKQVPAQYRRGYEKYVTSAAGYTHVYDIPRDRLLSAQRGWWTSIYRDVLQNAIRIGRKDTLDYKFLKEHQDIIPCQFEKVGYYYLSPDKNLSKADLEVAKDVRLVVNTLLNKKNKTPVLAL